MLLYANDAEQERKHQDLKEIIIRTIGQTDLEGLGWKLQTFPEIVWQVARLFYIIETNI